MTTDTCPVCRATYTCRTTPDPVLYATLEGRTQQAPRPTEERMTRRTPSEWETALGVIVLDPDGWDRRNFADDWVKPLTEAEFRAKASVSTTNWGVTR